MITINARNVQEALPKGLALLGSSGVHRESRNGEVLQAPVPVATIYSRPQERVLFHAWRDANPFFHLYESLWMLAGRNDLPPLLRYVPRFAEYSDDGGLTQNAAYGYRWRHAPTHGGMFKTERDQLVDIIELLKKNPLDRQCVLQIWDHERDLGTVTKDHACNLSATFQVDHRGELNMVVFCRSNDAIWGCYGANAVHFSVLLEYVARSAGLNVGTYTQISVNFHAYLKVFKPMYVKMKIMPSPYDLHDVDTFPLMSTPRESWDADLHRFIQNDGRATQDDSFGDPFFRYVAWPMIAAHDVYKDEPSPKKWDMIHHLLKHVRASDWRKAGTEWMQRRQEKVK